MNRLQQKLGPLKLWQWIAIGAALGVGVLVYRQTHPSGEGEAGTGELFGGTGTGAFGPIDPNTGVPYSFEGGPAGGLTEGSAAAEISGWINTLKELGLWPGSEGEGGGDGGSPAEEALGAIIPAAKRQQKAKSKAAANKAKNTKGPAVSTGAAAHAGGNSHTTAPHPAQRAGLAAHHTQLGPTGGGGGGAPAPKPVAGGGGGVAQVGGAGGASGGVVHPNAYSSGVGGGHPKPAPPAGYHTYMGANGQWWFAPN